MIKGYQLKSAMISATNNIVNNKKITNDLNIFPVPDGDTGTNMSMTISQAAEKIADLSDETDVSEVAKIVASAMLRGARGNSGVILSLLFRGFAQGLEGKSEVDGSDLAKALELGVSAAYKAVMKPAEGTILTVARVAAEIGKAAAEIDKDPVYVWGAVCSGAQQALEETPELLPVLKKAGVVDAGGFGLTLIYEGMLSVFKHGEIILSNGKGDDVDESSFESIIADYDAEINFTYCTEFIVGRDEECDKDPLELRDYLNTLGDSVVVVDDEEIIKVHVHTENPGDALQKALTYGQLLTVKIENMREQNKNITKSEKPEDLQPQEPTELYGFVSVAAGDGLIELFKELGCNHVVSGGQTMNPSTHDIVKAVLATPAKTVFVLPNNKNIIMAAEQAIPMVSDRTIVVIPTKTIPQGLTAMLSFDPDSSHHHNISVMNEVMHNVSTGLVTFAARNSEYDGHKIKEGEILGLVNGKMEFVSKTPANAAVKVARQLVDKHSSFVTLIYGCDTKEEDANSLYQTLKSKLGSHVEINLVNGGQPIYYYIISVE